jgi:hypothetical protein
LYRYMRPATCNSTLSCNIHYIFSNPRFCKSWSVWVTMRCVHSAWKQLSANDKSNCLYTQQTEMWTKQQLPLEWKLQFSM